MGTTGRAEGRRPRPYDGGRVKTMHDEESAIKEIKCLSLNARLHLSHVLRNGLSNILSATYQVTNMDELHLVRHEIDRMMKRIKEMDL